MISDHAEKLLDVWDVLHGQTRIFFPRNTGREAFQMYLTAGVIGLIGTGYTFLSLKIGTVLFGILTLPFIYLLGVEIANRRVGLIALAFAGIAYWPNIISRIALRFTFYPFFFAPALYFFLRGIRSSNRNYFILAGLFVGVGLHGYSTYRIVPIIFILAAGLYLLHRQSIGFRKEAILGLLLMGLISLLVFLPLLNYSLANPGNFSYRTLTRIGTIERAYPGSPLHIFLDNLWDAMTMFAWDNGEVWVLSVTDRPALDIVSGALFYLGFGLLLIRYIRRCHQSYLLHFQQKTPHLIVLQLRSFRSFS
jgi:4-amino-4-deoxy-L-arabinose transferase-like glycosyltransferase